MAPCHQNVFELLYRTEERKSQLARQAAESKATLLRLRSDLQEVEGVCMTLRLLEHSRELNELAALEAWIR